MGFQKGVLCAQTGKLLRGSAKEKFIKRSLDFHLGQLKRGFELGLLDQNHIENADEMHFIFNMGNDKTLEFRGQSHVKYANVIFGE